MEREEQLKQEIKDCGKLLIGIGQEWEQERTPDIVSVYDRMGGLIEGKDFFLVTAVTDGAIYRSQIDPSRITAPCGNVTWRQCSKSCTKDIWEAGEVPEDVCPHCGAPLTGNTVEAENYIEEGYLPQWKAYTAWLSGTLNRKLLILELGVDFDTPTVIRWPFEKTVFLNEKAHMYRINGKFPQLSEEIREKAVSFPVDSVKFFRNL